MTGRGRACVHAEVRQAVPRQGARGSGRGSLCALQTWDFCALPSIYHVHVHCATLKNVIMPHNSFGYTTRNSSQEPANRGVTPPDMAAQQEQSYRRSMREKNRKYCDNIGGNYGFGGGGGGRVRGAGGICRSEKSSAAANRGRDAALLGQFWRR